MILVTSVCSKIRQSKLKKKLLLRMNKKLTTKINKLIHSKILIKTKRKTLPLVNKINKVTPSVIVKKKINNNKRSQIPLKIKRSSMKHKKRKMKSAKQLKYKALVLLNLMPFKIALSLWTNTMKTKLKKPLIKMAGCTLEMLE